MKSVLLAGVVLAGAGLAGSMRLCAQVAPEESVSTGYTAATPEGLEPGGSQVRIVRLSQVRGSVQMDRNTGRGFEGAFTNIPVVAGAKLLTGEGIAEVEFEDNSSLRLAPGSEVEFARLGRTAAGETLTTVKLGKGVAYVSMQKGKDAGEFVLTDGAARVVMGPGAHLRMDATQPEVEVAVFEGSAQLLMGSAATTLARRETITLDPAMRTTSAVVKGTQEAGWDEWDKTQTSYHKGVSALAGAGGGFGLYGINDLGYYGSFTDMPGCGTMWRPYFASAAWDPFSNGIWAYYPGAGYSWVSPYPWGWMPYHSGTWASCGAAGWGWRPGGTWAGLTNHVLLRVPGRMKPVQVPPTPVRGASTLVPVNTRALTRSGMSEKGFAFRQDSAGLGVPRGDFGKLGGVSAHVEQHGVATSAVLPSSFVSPGTGSSGNSTNGGRSSGSSASSARSYGGSASASSSGGSAHSGGTVSMSSTGGGSVSSGGGASMSSGGGASMSSGGASSGGGGHH